MPISWFAIVCDAVFALTAFVFGIYLASDGLGLIPLPMPAVQFLLNASFILVPLSLIVSAAGAALLELLRFRRYLKVSLAFNFVFGGLYLAMSYSGI